jgi:two-component system LytT family response regulator
MKEITTLIVDDEQHCHTALQKLLEPYAQVKVVAHGFSVGEGLRLIDEHNPDLVFLDVEMPDGTGFDLLKRIGKPRFYVVFITGYNTHAEAAFLFGALDFMTKPVVSERLAETLDRVFTRVEEKYSMEQLRATLDSYQSLTNHQHLPTRICVPTAEGFEVIVVENIVHLDADRNLTDFHVLDRSKKLLVCKHLKDYETHFTAHDGFKRIMMRVHRSHIVNLKMVDKYIKGESRLVMRDGCKIPVSDSNRDGLMLALGGL